MVDDDTSPAVKRAMAKFQARADEIWTAYQAMPGYPWLPCPICHGTEGCDHGVPERARAAHTGLCMNL